MSDAPTQNMASGEWGQHDVVERDLLDQFAMSHTVQQQQGGPTHTISSGSLQGGAAGSGGALPPNGGMSQMGNPGEDHGSSNPNVGGYEMVNDRGEHMNHTYQLHPSHSLHGQDGYQHQQQQQQQQQQRIRCQCT